MGIVKRTVTSILTVTLLTALILTTAAAAPEEYNSPQEEAVATLITVQERMDAIEAQKGESEAYLAELNTQLNDLTEELNALQQRYSDKRAELDLANAQLDDAEAQASEQRENMALRIQYIYENSSGNGLLESVFSSDDFNDILTQSVNIRELSQYDRQLLDEYVAICEEIETKREQIELEQAEIEKLEDQNEAKRSEIKTVCEQTRSDIDEMAASLEEGQEEEALLLAAIQEQEEALAVWTMPVSQQVASADYYAAQYVQPAANSEAAAGTEAADASSSEEAAAEGGETESTETAAATAPKSTWTGSKLTRSGGVNQGPTGKETYYNLNMSGVINIMRNMGNNDQYWVRDDGVKMLGDYVMVAADLESHPRGSIVESSLGEAIVVDTGCLEKEQLDIAVAW